METQLDGESTRYMGEINKLTVSRARPWTDARAIKGSVDLIAAGQAFPAIRKL